MPFLSEVSAAKRSPQDDTSYGHSQPPPHSSNSPSPASNPDPSPLPPPAPSSAPPSSTFTPLTSQPPVLPETKVSLFPAAQPSLSFSTVPVFVSSLTPTATPSTASVSTTTSTQVSQPPAFASSITNGGAPFNSSNGNDLNLLKIGVPSLVGGMLLFVVLFLAIKCLYIRKRKARELKREQKGKEPLRSPTGGGVPFGYEMVPVTVIKDDRTSNGREWKILGGKLPGKKLVHSP